VKSSFDVLNENAVTRFVEAVTTNRPVTGLTHTFYRYPARFSPIFARAAIELFSKPGDLIVDPFSGGGTSIVEALALGRNGLGVDVSQLGAFLGGVKTMLPTRSELDQVTEWAVDIVPDLSPRNPVTRHWDWMEAGYQDNVPWRFRKIAEQAINSAEDVLSKKLRPIARCVVLKSLQWALDCKKRLPTASAFRDRMIENVIMVTTGYEELVESVRSNGAAATVEFIEGSADSIDTLPSKLLERSQARLVVTSPPYPSVHVLYHRWQVQGRRETAAPFWVADCLDGEGSAFYTFSDRRNQRHEEIYFGKLLAAFKGVRKIVHEEAAIVQLVGFGKPEEQLPQYLRTMEEAGFVEMELNGHRTSQMWRPVPNRKWYNSLRDDIKQTFEILLVHRPK
jgi:DNA modification methylase